MMTVVTGSCKMKLVEKDSAYLHYSDVTISTNHKHVDCFLSRLFGRTSKKISKLRVTGLCKGNPLVTQRISLAKGQ